MPNTLPEIISEFEKVFSNHGFHPQEKERFIQFITSTYHLGEQSALTEAERILEETSLADGFVGFSDEEWRGAKKIIKLMSEKLHSLHSSE